MIGSFYISCIVTKRIQYCEQNAIAKKASVVAEKLIIVDNNLTADLWHSDVVNYDYIQLAR